jgi:hypothetical protein
MHMTNEASLSPTATPPPDTTQAIGIEDLLIYIKTISLE